MQLQKSTDTSRFDRSHSSMKLRWVAHQVIQDDFWSIQVLRSARPFSIQTAAKQMRQNGQLELLTVLSSKKKSNFNVEKKKIEEKWRHVLYVGHRNRLERYTVTLLFEQHCMLSEYTWYCHHDKLSFHWHILRGSSSSSGHRELYLWGLFCWVGLKTLWQSCSEISIYIY